MYFFPSITIGIFTFIILSSYTAFRKVFLFKKKRPQEPLDGLDDEPPETKEIRIDMIKNFLSVPCEEVSIKSYDGKTLYASYYNLFDGAPLTILFHGYKSLGVRDFSAIAAECMKLRQNLLLIDQRAHGRSEGKVISFGIKERFDCKSWVDYAVGRFGKDTKILLYGISMGAATVLMASELPLKENVKGIVADCPYSSPKDIILKVCRDRRLPPWLISPFIRLGAILFGGFKLDECSAENAVTKTKIPILLIHGEADDFVPCTMSDKIARKGRTVTYLKVPGANHGRALIYGRKAYLSKLTAFLNDINKL